VLGDARHVEDQCDPAVAHDRGAGEGRHLLEDAAERLDHDLRGVADVVDDEAELTIVGLQHDDVHTVGRCRRLLAEHLVQVHDREQAATKSVHGCAMDELDRRLRIVGVDPHEFEQAHLGDGEPVVVARDHERRNDRERQRDLDLEGRALAEFRLDVDGATDRPVAYTHLRAHETVLDLVCRLLLEE